MKHQNICNDYRLNGVCKNKGITLIEVIISLTIIAIITTTAVPSIRNMLLNSRISSNSMEFSNAIFLARSEAIKRSRSVAVCQSTNGTSCSGNYNWASGWLVWVDTNANEALETGEEIVQIRLDANSTSTIDSTESVSVLRFLATGFLAINVAEQRNFTLCDNRTGENGKLINIRASGRVVVSTMSCN